METERVNESPPGVSAALQGGEAGAGVDTVGSEEVAIVARIYLQRTQSGFVPADEPSLEIARKYKIGEVYRADVAKPRSYQHHKLCMALLNLTFEHLPERYAMCYPTFDTFRYAVAKESGHCEAFVDLQGEITSVPKSISYDAIPDDVEFGKIMAAMMTICANILQVEQPLLEQEVARYADQHYGRAA